MSAIKTGTPTTTGSYSRNVDSAEAYQGIYDEVKDGHKHENQQSIQHLDDSDGKTALNQYKSSIKTYLNS